MTVVLNSPLDAVHREQGGRMVEFAGWSLPIRYGSILDEAKAVRNTTGLFDVSHMGRFFLRGPGAFETLQKMGTNDLSKIKPGKCQYTLWCDEEGRCLDDLIVCWLEDEEFLIVVNASNRIRDFIHLDHHLNGADAVDCTSETAMIAVQGPTALSGLKALGADIEQIPRFGVGPVAVAGVTACASRTGYTGEDGVELVAEADEAETIWKALTDAGATPCGLGARDALRMEMGLPLYGHELDEHLNPREASVDFAIKLESEFVGAEALRKKEPQRRLIGFRPSRPCIPAQGDRIAGDGWDGEVTSGGTSVVLGSAIGLGFVPRDVSAGTATLHNRGREIEIELSPLPLIERKRP